MVLNVLRWTCALALLPVLLAATAPTATTASIGRSPRPLFPPKTQGSVPCAIDDWGGTMMRCYPVATLASVERSLKVRVVDPVRAVARSLNLPVDQLVVVYGRDGVVAPPTQWRVEYIFGTLIVGGVASPGPLYPTWLILDEGHGRTSPQKRITVAPHGNQQPPVFAAPAPSPTPATDPGTIPQPTALPTFVYPWRVSSGLIHHHLLVGESSNAPLDGLKRVIRLLWKQDAR
jgi:hypothetical protein